jgi:MOB kinase activator 1
MAQNESAHQSNQAPATRKSPLFFREENAGFIARGNFMTLALKPQLVEEGEWLAHQGERHTNRPLLGSTLTPLSI